MIARYTHLNEYISGRLHPFSKIIARLECLAMDKNLNTPLEHASLTHKY